MRFGYLVHTTLRPQIKQKPEAVRFAAGNGWGLTVTRPSARLYLLISKTLTVRTSGFKRFYFSYWQLDTNEKIYVFAEVIVCECHTRLFWIRTPKNSADSWKSKAKLFSWRSKWYYSFQIIADASSNWCGTWSCQVNIFHFVSYSSRALNSRVIYLEYIRYVKHIINLYLNFICTHLTLCF